MNDLSVQNETLIKQINEKDMKIINLQKDVQALRLNAAFQNSKRVNNIEEEIQRRDQIIQTLKSAVDEKNQELLREKSNSSALKQENDERQERIFYLSCELSQKTDEIKILERKIKDQETKNIEIPEPPPADHRSQQLFVNIVEPPKQVTKLHDTVVESIFVVKTK